MRLPERFDLQFPGFNGEAFEILSRLRADPNVAQYRMEKEAIQREIMEPFRLFRDDLVVNVVLPNHLPLETERNVFSRLLKNDFGAGGSHSHVWMSFYRPDRSRLADLQPFHGIEPDGFYSGLHVGGRDRSIVRNARDAFAREPDVLRDQLNELLRQPGWTFSVSRGSGTRKEEYEVSAPIPALPDVLRRAASIAIYRFFERGAVLTWREQLVPNAAAAMASIWPLYEAFAAAGGEGV